jgi:hypothetical protein
LILITALLAGLAAGLLIARWQKSSWTIPRLRASWLVIMAFLPQFFMFYLPATRTLIPDGWVASGLAASQILLLVFCWLNRQIAGVWVLAFGLVLNLLVIATNGGFMPISPQTASHLIPETLLQTLQVGRRFGYGKDILLLPEKTNLVWLSDRYLTPAWVLRPVAFSLGDILISAGAFWILATQGKPSRVQLIRKDIS